MKAPQLAVDERVEIIHAVRRDKEWAMTGGDVSALFELVATENWRYNLKHPYWEVLYAPVLARLNEQPENLVEISLLCKYEHGIIPEKAVSAVIGDFAKIPTKKVVDILQAVTVKNPLGLMVRVSSRNLEDGMVAICQMTVIDLVISRLEPELA